MICMFLTNSERLISISDAFSAFCLWVSVIFPTCSQYPKQKRAYSALHQQAYTGHACRHLPSAVPWISKDHLFTPLCVDCASVVCYKVRSTHCAGYSFHKTSHNVHFTSPCLTLNPFSFHSSPMTEPKSPRPWPSKFLCPDCQTGALHKDSQLVISVVAHV